MARKKPFSTEAVMKRRRSIDALFGEQNNKKTNHLAF
jgi:hypothetical protein